MWMMPTSFASRVGLIAGAVALASLLLLLSPLHLAGAVVFVVSVAILSLARPDIGLWLVLLLFAVHPFITKVAQVNLGVTGTALLVFSAWKEVALGSVLVARAAAIIVTYRRSHRLPLAPALMDIVAGVLVVLVVVGFVMRHDGLALNASRLILFPIGVYLALRMSPVNLERYLTLTVAIAAAISVLAFVEGSFLGFSFVTSYWGSPKLPIPGTFVAQYLQGPRAAGTLGSPNELGFALSAWGVMAVALLVMKPSRHRWAAAALFAILVALALTFSRSAIVAAGVGIVFVTIVGLYLSPIGRRAVAYVALAILPALILCGVIYAERGGTTLFVSTWSSLSSLSSTDTGGGTTPVVGPTPSEPAVDTSTQDHLNSISSGWAVIKNHPIGLGLGTVGSRVDPLTSERPQYIFESWYLTMGVALGWVGLAWAVFLPIAMFLTALLALRRGRPIVGLSLLGASITAAIISYWLPSLMQPQLAMIPWSLAALALVPSSGQKPASSRAA